MKYENARDVLPPDVLKLVQRHSAGKLIYVPQARERLPWGERSGYRLQLDERNAAIRRRFVAGSTADDLADEYFLTPETIKKIVYSRKEKNTMELNEIFKIYSDEAPDGYDVVFDEEWEEGDREAGFALEVFATFGRRTLCVSVSDYVYVTHERVADFDRRAKAYDAAGIPTAHITRTRTGELWKDVVFRDRTCIVYAWEAPEGYSRFDRELNDASRDENGRYLWHDDMIVKLAAVASARIETESENCLELFDIRSSCFGKYEDWCAEELAETLARYREASPELSDKLDAIESAANAARDALRPVYPILPRSSFPGGWNGSFYIGVRGGAQEVALIDFVDGGSMASAAHIACECVFTTEYLPDNYTLAELSDPDVRRRRIAAREHDLHLFAEHYRLNADERGALPLLYRLISVRDFAWDQANAIIAAGEEATSAALDGWLRRLTTDELDFAAILV